MLGFECWFWSQSSFTIIDTLDTSYSDRVGVSFSVGPAAVMLTRVNHSAYGR
jgi:hypothetical protein